MNLVGALKVALRRHYAAYREAEAYTAHVRWDGEVFIVTVYAKHFSEPLYYEVTSVQADEATDDRP